MKTAILLENGFEDTEAITTRDVLLRSHAIEVTMLSCCGSLSVTSSHGLEIKADRLIEDKREEYDFLILPGGKKGVDGLKANAKAIEMIRRYKEAGKPVYAICAAPSILGELGYLEETAYTCYPGFETGKNYTGEGVTVSEGLITGKAMFYSIDFALAIIERHVGKEIAESVIKGAKGE